jgi:hypothetical protein
VDGAADAQLDVAAGKFVNDVLRIRRIMMRKFWISLAPVGDRLTGALIDCFGFGERVLERGGTRRPASRQRNHFPTLVMRKTHCMASWRNSASQLAQDDLDELLNAVLPFAIETLGSRGELYPFGATIAKDGLTALSAADPGVGERPNSNEVLSLLRDGVTADKDSLRAAAYVADVRVEGGDAIRVELEHSEGVAIVVLVPYSRSRLRKSVKVGEMRVQPGELHAWDG